MMQTITQEREIMTTSGQANMPPIAELQAGEEIDTRFGRVTIYRTNPLVFPNGVLGIPDKYEYCLTNFPSEKLARFKLLQSLDEAELSFITLPLDIDNKIIDKADIETACKDLAYAPSNVTLLLLVTVHRAGNQVRLSVNARAPILIDTPRRIASQYVFHNSKYDIQHMITL
jgi:flagellar assembly factor FliW